MFFIVVWLEAELEWRKKRWEETIKHHRRKPFKHFNDDDKEEDDDEYEVDHDDDYGEDDNEDFDDDTEDDDDEFGGTPSWVQISRSTVGVCPTPLWSLHYYH